MSGLTSEDIDKILDEVEAELKIEQEKRKKLLESKAICIVATFPKNLTPEKQFFNYKGGELQSFIEAELNRISNGKPRESMIPVELLESFHGLYNLFGSRR